MSCDIKEEEESNRDCSQFCGGLSAQSGHPVPLLEYSNITHPMHTTSYVNDNELGSESTVKIEQPNEDQQEQPAMCDKESTAEKECTENDKYMPVIKPEPNDDPHELSAASSSGKYWNSSGVCWGGNSALAMNFLGNYGLDESCTEVNTEQSECMHGNLGSFERSILDDSKSTKGALQQEFINVNDIKTEPGESGADIIKEEAEDNESQSVTTWIPLQEPKKEGQRNSSEPKSVKIKPCSIVLHRLNISKSVIAAYMQNCNKADTVRKEYPCTICKKTYRYHYTATMHRYLHDGQVHQCFICGKTFKWIKYLKEHEANHMGKRYKCEICGKEYTNRANLKSHSYSHTGQRFECTICKKTFVSTTTLKNHQVVHNANNQRFNCSICDKRFKYKQDMKKHELLHISKGNFQCSICHQSFNWAASLKRHQYEHLDQTFPCSTCGKTFKSPFNLKLHERLHLGKEYECDICGKVFSLKKNLRQHQGVHSDVRPSCDVCGKSFSCVYTLRAHKRIHQGTDHVCEVCGTSFITPSKLKRHLENTKKCSKNASDDVDNDGSKETNNEKQENLQ